jgi:hypothetical protein
MATPYKPFLNRRNLNKSLKTVIIQKLGLPPGTLFESKLSTNSAYGVIFPIKGVDKVLKVVRSYTSKSADFDTEVSVGQLPGIEKVGTKIYQHAYFRYLTNSPENGKYEYIGAYVMDNLLSLRERRNGNTVKSLYDYTYSLRGSCPSNEIVKMYTKLLVKFYKISRGWHGDLHTGNIQVILDRRGVPKRMMVIDYGSHTRLKNQNRLNRASCLDEILDAVKHNFNSMPFVAGSEKTHPAWAPSVHKQPLRPREQVVASDANVLRESRMHKIYLRTKKLGYNKNTTLANSNNENVNERRRLNENYRNINERTKPKRLLYFHAKLASNFLKRLMGSKVKPPNKVILGKQVVVNLEPNRPPPSNSKKVKKSTRM